MTERLVSIHRRTRADVFARKPMDRRYPTASEPLIVSPSEIADFLRCRQSWWWKYQCGLVPVAPSTPRLMGIVGHQILEEWYKLPHTKRSVEAMRHVAKRITAHTSLEGLSTEDMELVRAMTIGYAEWTLNKRTDHGDAVLKVREVRPEEWFELPLVKDRSILLRGRFDARFEPRALKRTVALLESKFKGQIRMNDLEMRTQNNAYLWAMRQQWPRYKRWIVYYQILRKQMPGPRVRSDLFSREPVERSDEEIAQWAEDTRRVALDMLEATITGNVYPNMMESCAWMCDFKTPCLLRGNDRDVKFVMRNEYTNPRKDK